MRSRVSLSSKSFTHQLWNSELVIHLSVISFLICKVGTIVAFVSQGDKEE